MKLTEVTLDSMVGRLLKMCQKELGLSDTPDIYFIDDRSTVGGGTSFGEFTDNGLYIVTKDRHPVDVMRTLAHELVHYKQRLDNVNMDGSDGSDTENEANAVAGVIMRKFGKEYPECFTLRR